MFKRPKCVTIACDGCGCELEMDYVPHFPDESNANDIALDCEWFVRTITEIPRCAGLTIHLCPRTLCYPQGPSDCRACEDSLDDICDQHALTERARAQALRAIELREKAKGEKAKEVVR